MRLDFTHADECEWSSLPPSFQTPAVEISDCERRDETLSLDALGATTKDSFPAITGI